MINIAKKTKENRLSFRINDEISLTIDNLIKISKEQTGKDEIRDRSEFGTKAVKFYIAHLLNYETNIEQIYSAIKALADKTNLSDLKEIKNLFNK